MEAPPRHHVAWIAAAWIALGGCLCVGNARAGVIRHDRDDADYTDLAAQTEFDPVGEFRWTESGGGFLASGTLISNEWVLTAAHVIDGTDDRGAGVSNLRFEVGGRTVNASEWTTHPDWSASDSLFAGWDLGLVRLSTPIHDLGPARLYTDRDELAQTATIVGFGATGTGLTGSTQASGTKRAGQNVIDAVGRSRTPGSTISPPNNRLVTIDFDNPDDPSASTLGAADPLDLEYLTAPGDSGGGLFLGEGDDVLLAAVTSLGSSLDDTGANSDYGDRASFTRVSSFLEWIEETSGLELTDTPAGDYNLDGLVDVDDYRVWQQQFGFTGLNLTADGNGDGLVDTADFTLWRDNAAAADGAVSAVLSASALPEPTGLATIGTAAATLLGARRRRPRPPSSWRPVRAAS